MEGAYKLVKLRIRIAVINPCSSPRRFNTPRHPRRRPDTLVYQLHFRFHCIWNYDRRRNLGKEPEGRRDVLEELRHIFAGMSVRVRIQLAANLLQALDRRPAKFRSKKCSAKNEQRTQSK